MKRDMDEEFRFFLGQLPNSESIDELELPSGYEESQKADFFLENRRVIVEVKSLKSNPYYKVDEVLSGHREREDFPMFFGEMQLNKVLKHLPDGKEISSQIFGKVTKSVEVGFKKANRQIAATRMAFEERNALGILIYINESIDILDPSIIGQKLGSLLSRKERNGSYRYQNIQQVWIFNDTHYQQYSERLKLIPILCLDGPTHLVGGPYEDLSTSIFEAWSRHTGIHLVDAEADVVERTKFLPFSKLEMKDETSITKQELWRRQYRESPYLQNLSESQFGEHGARLIKLLERNFLKGRDKMPQDKFNEAMIGWVHFVEEASIRGFDMKKIPSR